MLHRFFALVACLTLSAGCASKPAPTARYAPPSYPLPGEVHPLAVAPPPHAEHNTATLGRWFRAEPNPYLRAKAVHDWIATKITYATEEYLAGEVNGSHAEPAPVFARRRGVCAGMSALFVEIGTYAALEAKVVNGHVGWSGPTWDRDMRPHAWNAVRIDGAWHLLDVTWDNGIPSSIRPDNAYSTDYLFPPPDYFLVEHYPEQWSFQLKQRPISQQEFLRQPYFTRDFFVQGWVFEGAIEQGGQLAVTVRATRDAGLGHGHIEDVLTRTSRPCDSSVATERMVAAGERIVITCPLGVGRQALRLHMGPSAPEDSYGMLAEVYVGQPPPREANLLRDLPWLPPAWPTEWQRWLPF